MPDLSGLWGNPGERAGWHSFCSSVAMSSLFTQIYEGTNQVQRIVMARQLLKD
jgi:alkylation response protein AidB-like acyl-CoA dehydrogenase